MTSPLIRIEHPSDGMGVYRTSGVNISDHPKLNWFIERHATYNPNGMKTPHAEGLTFISGMHLCAFRNIEEFMQYVHPEEVVFIVDLGFKIYEIKSSDVQFGQKQAIFVHDSVISKKDVSDDVYKICKLLIFQTIPT